MKCRKCKEIPVKNGRIKSSGKQRYYCKTCNESFVEYYDRNAFRYRTDRKLIKLIKEGNGIRGIGRYLEISPKTVILRIKKIAKEIHKPMILKGRTYEMDEMYTYIGRKDKRICIAYAIDRKTRGVVGFSVGRRNLKTLGLVTDSLILSEALEVRTDKLNLYKTLLPVGIHHVKRRGINYIERKNLTLRTHLKRLNRRTLAYSKNISMLSAILKIYFWG